MLTHPLIGDLSSKTTEELEETIARLNKNLTFAGRMNNQAMFNQLIMTINTYREEYRRRQDEIWNKKSGDLSGKIDIS